MSEEKKCNCDFCKLHALRTKALKKCNCDFCKLHALRTKALESDDIEFVKKTLKEFSDMWLNVSEDLSYYKCIMDGSWPSADVLLTDALEKFNNHPNRELE